ncbi:MAG: hypothetical protein R3F61_29300 [Myxococcota bacterium]
METASDLLTEIDRQSRAFAEKRLPDMRRLADLLERVPVDSICDVTGATPLLWAIDQKSPVAKFLLTRGPDVSQRGTGRFDVLPIELAMQRGLHDLARSLTAHGAVVPAALAAQMAAEQAARTAREAELQSVSRHLEGRLADPGFQAVIAELEADFGVPAKRVRGQPGRVTFPRVPARKLARAAGLEDPAWLVHRVRTLLPRGVSLYAAVPPDQARLDLCAAPTASWRAALTTSRLLSDRAQLHPPHEKLERADQLAVFATLHPFALVVSGPLGVLVHLDTTPPDATEVARWALEACPELESLVDRRGDPAEAAVARDLRETGLLWLPWGVES